LDFGNITGQTTAFFEADHRKGAKAPFERTNKHQGSSTMQQMARFTDLVKTKFASSVLKRPGMS